MHDRLLLPLALLLVPPAVGQNGDQQGEDQPPLPAELAIPPAPVLTPEEQLATFALPPGFRIELVAAEPLVVDPVALAFDQDGRLWVCEMRGYMPDADGQGEHAEVGVIAVLEDTDGDGRMDARTEFMRELILPRAVQPTRGGALVIAPPNLVFARDTDDDGAADAFGVHDTGLKGLPIPEHAINGLMPTLDNWFRVANESWRYRWEGTRLVKGPTRGGGQWGITKDDMGRVFFNTNPDPLRGDLYPSHYSIRNPHLGAVGGTNVGFVRDKSTWPARINPGVNRGYRQETLRDDFTLASFTAACGPLIYRGGALGADYQGNAFVCEPTGNMLKRYVFREKGGIELEAVNAWEGREFLTSTDERFRPVNLCDGPDGGLYVADLARGLVQHRIYLTTFLRKQVDERGLAGPMGLGRIWRVVRADAPRTPVARISEWSWSELVAGLGSANGWVRDTCQRAIVEDWGTEDDAFVAGLLRDVARDAERPPLARVHALWTLAGVGEVDAALVLDAARDGDARVRLTAARVGEELLATGHPLVTEAVLGIGLGSDPRARHQALLSLGEARSDAADAGLAALLTRDAANAHDRAAFLSGAAKREHAFLEVFVPAWADELAGRADVLQGLARCVVREGVGERIERLLELAGAARPWQQRALLDGVLAARGKDPRGDVAPIRVGAEPAAHAGLVASAHASSAELAQRVAGAIVWPGKPGYEEVAIRPLTTDERARFERGREFYTNICAACHQPSGWGEPGKAPPLRGQKWTLGSERRFARILLQGLGGDIEVEGEVWNQEMPAVAAGPEDIAAVMTYVRREWGHGADPVTPALVREVIAATVDRRRPWTAAELDALED
jgi:mono/diheme cytochrome c family protein/glucose/arabinose dehydrogenase